MNLRSKLEAQQAEFLRMLESGETQSRARIANELRKTVDDLAALDAGEHWTQVPSETLQKIVVNDLAASVKKNGA